MLSNSRLIGRWKSVDPWQTEVRFEITQAGDTYRVRAVDTDGEEAEIYDVTADGNDLKFAALWSSGQLTKYRFRPLGKQLEVVFTYTGTMHFERDGEGSNP